MNMNRLCQSYKMHLKHFFFELKKKLSKLFWVKFTKSMCIFLINMNEHWENINLSQKTVDWSKESKKTLENKKTCRRNPDNKTVFLMTFKNVWMQWTLNLFLKIFSSVLSRIADCFCLFLCDGFALFTFIYFFFSEINAHVGLFKMMYILITIIIIIGTHNAIIKFARIQKCKL